MSATRGQQQTFLRLVTALRPHLRRDAALPSRIQALFSQHKEFGSRDRRLYRELLYTTVRYLPWIEPALDAEPEAAVKIVAWLAAETRDTTAFRRELAGDWPVLGSLTDRAAHLSRSPDDLLPAWLREECPEAFTPAQLDALLARAPLWLRFQAADPKPVVDEFAERGWRLQRSELTPAAWKVLDDADVTKTDVFARGLIEVQDLGSQLLLESVGIKRGGHWFDACAGAGGKTLQLALLLGASGVVDAHDVRQTALDELIARASRAAGGERARGGGEISGIPNAATIRVLRKGPAATMLYDGVLIDAPCSGSGTWRRSPHLKWTTTPAMLQQKAELQTKLLAEHAPRVRPGGRLIYATCSMAKSENEAAVAQFLASNRDFEPSPFAQTFGYEPRGPGLTLLPARHDTDGFFVASLRRR